MIHAVLSFLAKAFMVLLMIAALVGVVGFFRIMFKGSDKESGSNMNNNSGLPWL